MNSEFNFLANVWRALLYCLLLFSLCCSAPEPRYEQIFIGTYTGSGSQGIYSSLLNIETGELTEPKLSAETANPSFFTIQTKSLDHIVYAVNEVSDYGIDTTGAVSAFAVRVGGTWGLLGQVSSQGASPCHISLDQSGRFVLVANYTGGTIAVYRLDEKGAPGELTAKIKHEGAGPNIQRQDRPHPHYIQTTKDNKFVLVADLGSDKIMVYRFDAETGRLSPHDPPFASLEPGAGPRHLVIDSSGKRIYVLNELNSTISYFTMDPGTGTMSLKQTISTLPPDFTGSNTSAEITLDADEDIVYASNRGHDSIVMFEVKKNTGELMGPSWKSTGKGPRHFSLDLTGKWMLVANHQGNSIDVFQVDHDGRKVQKTSHSVKISEPVCVKVAGGDQ